MKFYFFGGDFNSLNKIYENKFDGTLFLYNSASSEFFTDLAYHSNLLKKDFKYMVAIRPYVISPQYLSMIHRSFYSKMGDMLQINLISGWIKPEEKPFNSFVGEVNDESNSIERSEYLIKYLKAINNLKNNLNNIKSEKFSDIYSIEKNIPDIYVSTTNNFVFDAASQYNNKMIIPYSLYKKDFDLSNKDFLISIGPIIRKNKKDLENLDPANVRNDMLLCTPESLINTLKDFKNKNVGGVLLFAWEEERDRLFDFMKNYKDLI